MLCTQAVEANQIKLAHHSPSKYVSDQVWNEVKEYLLPDDHPVKKKLDLMFSNDRILSDIQSLEKAGFDYLPPQHRTQMIVAKHPDLKGIVIKAYLDEQEYYEGRPEHYYWIRRIKGARLIQRYIDTHHYGNLFKVPGKWIYLLSDKPSPPRHYLRKKFILIAEDMELYDDKTNEELWGNDEWVTKKRLRALYAITTDLGLLDSAKPSNCFFSVDGKAAFVDTELYRKTHIRYDKLTPFLSPSMQDYWRKITHNRSQLPIMN
ncbi:MAG: hypothetical protein ACH350_00465 [Parachlamydiaceae bacterium]